MDLLTIPKDFKAAECKLGDKIVRTPEIVLSIPKSCLFYGIKHLNIIDKVTFVIINYTSIHEVDGELVDDVWVLSKQYLIPTLLLIEYNDNLKMDVKILIDKKKLNKYCTFSFMHYEHLQIDELDQLKRIMYLRIPTIKPGVDLEFIGKIWRLVSNWTKLT